MNCSLCSDPNCKLMAFGQEPLPFCALCVQSILEPYSVAGKLLRRGANRARRQLKIRERQTDPKRTPEVRKSLRKSSAKYASNPENKRKIAARDAVHKAVKRGKIVKPSKCSMCGLIPARGADGRSEIHFHHTNGYAKKNRLVGIWLCRSCHKDLDAKEKTLKAKKEKP